MTFSLFCHPERGSGATESKGLWIRGRAGFTRGGRACREGFPQILDLVRLAVRSAQDDEGRSWEMVSGDLTLVAGMLVSPRAESGLRSRADAHAWALLEKGIDSLVAYGPPCGPYW
jgi:hypothetical protein